MKLRPFEIFLVTTFAILGVLAVVMLSLFKPAEDPQTMVISGPVLIWGVLPEEPIRDALNEMTKTEPSLSKVTYKYVPPERFNEEFVTALADRKNPDIVLLPHEELVTQRTRLAPYTYEQVSLRDYRDRYIDGAEIFALRDGVYAVPIAVDPLVLYWNRTLVGNAGFLQPPASWEELGNTVLPALTTRDFDRTVRQSAVAMGEADNVQNIVPILSMLALQAGSQFVTETETEYQIQIDEAQNRVTPFTSALEFYMRFSDPTNSYYSWNRAQPNDRESFTRETLALYFGLASEGKELLERNPNLDFDVAEVPKGASVQLRRTYGRFYGLSIVRNASNPQAAYGAMNLLSSPEIGAQLAQAFAMAPATRQGLAAGTTDLFGQVAYKAAPVARGWLAPGTGPTKALFTDMVSRASSDRTRLPIIATDAVSRLRLEY